MKFLKSLPARLLLGILLGIALGLVLPREVMEVVVTLKYILGQIITFCVPLIIIGFIACVTASYLELRLWEKY